MDVSCYLSIELDSGIELDKPLSEMSKLLRQAADKIDTFEEGQELEETVTLRIGRKRAGQMDFYVPQVTHHD